MRSVASGFLVLTCTFRTPVAVAIFAAGTIRVAVSRVMNTWPWLPSCHPRHHPAARAYPFTTRPEIPTRQAQPGTRGQPEQER
jgi:hypothetical protein